MYDGTPVTAHANKGVIMATGGYAANLQMVVDTNVYWSNEYVSTSTKAHNRSSLQGDGITMAQTAGADVTGMGFTQMMPISWIDNRQPGLRRRQLCCVHQPHYRQAFRR